MPSRPNIRIGGWVLASACSILIFGACSTGNDKADAFGNFEAREVVVSSEAAGRLISFEVDEGAALSRNQVVGLVDTVQLALKKTQLLATRRAVRSRLAAIAAQIAVLEEQRRVAETESTRIAKLLQDNAATTKQRDDIEGQIAIIDRQIQQAVTQRTSVYAETDALDAQIAQVDDQIDRAVIVNPIPGTVLSKFVEPHELVGYGRPLYKLADLSTMELRAYVSGSQLPGVRIGQTVEVQIDADDSRNRSLGGEITWIASEAEFTPKLIQTKQERVNLVYAFKVRVANPDGALKVGMPGEVYLRNP